MRFLLSIFGLLVFSAVLTFGFLLSGCDGVETKSHLPPGVEESPSGPECYCPVALVCPAPDFVEDAGASTLSE